MKRLILLTALLAVGSYQLSDISSAHGGSYRGPGDTVPPGGGGGGGGGSGPTNPGPAGPPTGGPNQPGGPARPGSGGTTGTGGSGGARPSTGGGEASKDGSWESWWGFNKDAYLQLKRAVHEVDIYTGAFEGGAKPTLRPSEETIRGKVVPALKQALATERGNDIVTGCLIALAKIGDVINGDDGSSEFEALIVPFLKDPSQEIAETSAVALGILANDASFKTLRSLTRDDEDGRKLVGAKEVPFRTRAFATYGLGLLGSRTSQNMLRQDIVRTLVEAVESPNASMRDVKVAAVIAIGIVPIDWVQDAALETRADSSLSRQSQLNWLGAKLADTRLHEQVRAHAPTAIARLMDGANEELRLSMIATFADVINVYSRYDKPVRQSTVVALGSLARLGDAEADTKARTVLEAIIKEKRDDMQTRDFAAISLAQLGGRGAGESVEGQRSKLRSFLLEEASRGDSHIRPWASLAVGVMERAVSDGGGSVPLGVRETLRSLFNEAKAPDAVGSLAIAIGITRDAEARKLLLAKLEKTSEAITQGYLCVALGLVDARESIPAIESVITKSKYKPELLRQAAIGVGLLGDKTVVPMLVEMLNQSTSFASQAAIASALGFIGDARSIDPLVSMLLPKQGRSESARGFAAVALGIVGDKEMLPWNSKISANINYIATTSTLTDASGTGILDIL